MTTSLNTGWYNVYQISGTEGEALSIVAVVDDDNKMLIFPPGLRPDDSVPRFHFVAVKKEQHPDIAGLETGLERARKLQRLDNEGKTPQPTVENESSSHEFFAISFSGLSVIPSSGIVKCDLPQAERRDFPWLVKTSTPGRYSIAEPLSGRFWNPGKKGSIVLGKDPYCWAILDRDQEATEFGNDGLECADSQDQGQDEYESSSDTDESTVTNEDSPKFEYTTEGHSSVALIAV